jgi:pilus assembly protein CpaF
MNTGHDGSFSTCHANGPLDALLRLESLVLQAAPTWPLPAIRQQLARSLDVVVHMGRSRSAGKRRLVSICEVGAPNHNGEPRLVPVAELGTDERLVQVGDLRSRR